MKRKIDYATDCTVYIIGIDPEGIPVKLFYERPQLVDDQTLTDEARYIFEDCKRGGIGNINELVAIFIARSTEQATEMETGAARVPQQ